VSNFRLGHVAEITEAVRVAQSIGRLRSRPPGDWRAERCPWDSARGCGQIGDPMSFLHEHHVGDPISSHQVSLADELTPAPGAIALLRVHGGADNLCLFGRHT
jgi:hypothetical protein